MRTIKIQLDSAALVAKLVEKAQQEVDRANHNIEFYQKERAKYQNVADHATNNLPITVDEVFEQLGEHWVRRNAAADSCGFCGNLVMDGIEIIQDADENEYDSQAVCTFICSSCMKKHVANVAEIGSDNV